MTDLITILVGGLLMGLGWWTVDRSTDLCGVSTSIGLGIGGIIAIVAGFLGIVMVLCGWAVEALA
jgi:hypothetical protein